MVRLTVGSDIMVNFWKMLKRERDGPSIKTPSIKDPNGKVVHNVDDIL